MRLKRGARIVAKGLLALATPIVFAGATATCFSPTEVSLVVTTDLACTARPLTAIEVGESPTGQSSVADTSACEVTGPREATIGSLTVVPSGSRKARVSVRVTLALPPKAPADCTRASPEGCIVATRSVSFIEHSSRSLPIRLYSNCLGILCEQANQSCKQGQCVDNDASNFELPEPLDGGGPTDAPLDIGIDQVVDAPPPGACSGPNGDGILAAPMALPTALVASDTTLFWALDQQNSLPKHPAVGQQPTKTPFPGTVTALAVTGSTLYFAYESPPSGHLLGRANVPTPWQVPGTTNSLAFGPNGTLYVLNGENILSSDGLVVPTQFEVAGGTTVVANNTNVYILDAPSGASGGTLVTFPVGAPPGDVAVPLVGSYLLLASNQHEVVTTAPPPPASLTAPKIARVVGTSAKNYVADANGPVTSLAVAATEVFWSEMVTGGAQIAKVPLIAANAAPPTILATGVTFADIRHLVVDADPNGCVYFWAKDSTGGTALRIAPKK